MSIKINTINVEPGDSFIINHGGRVEASLAIAALKDGIRVCGPMNSTRKEFYFSENGGRGVEDIMTKEGLAAKLNGNEYGHEISSELEAGARENSLVVVFGTSDYLVEFW